jgi:TPR repeat protein
LIRAVEYYKLSADQGNSDGQNNFGRCLENGFEIEKNLIRAAEYYKLSVDQRNSDGRDIFGRCLENGFGIEKDLICAINYYKLLALASALFLALVFLQIQQKGLR